MLNSQSESISLSQQDDHTTANISLETDPDWTVSDSEKLYNIEGWGEPYFAINQAGNVTVTLEEQGKPIELLEIVESLSQQGISSPLLIRFPDILADRLARLHNSMAQAIARYEYQGKYQGVFPIKCNQNRQLIEALVNYGKPYHFGLEAGSKPELMIALACLASVKEGQPLLMCNGYKDREYLETALLATRLGHKPIIVIEQLQELDLLIAIAQELEISPIIGVRAKLNSKGIGRWGDSTGDRAKFGLTVAEILQILRQLESIDKLHWLQLLHFHIGSQISAIGVIKSAIREASQIYVQLAKLGAKMQYLNVGGGLAVDYDGSKTNVPASKNYNMQNYANDIVAQVKDACDQSGVTHPILISESGRAIASHQSVLVFNVLGKSQICHDNLTPPTPNAPLVIKNFWDTYQGINHTNLQESYHDAIQFKQEALSLFNFGYLSLVERSQTEELYWACCRQIAQMLQETENLPDELASLPQVMASTYYINLSIFRSAPDSWAIEQLFPIMPLHRLQEKPTVKGVLADITCDSDGKIDKFIDPHQTKKTLELHPLDSKSTTPYYLGMFLVGAYQEIMGNLHNLFGDTNVVQIKSTPTGYQVESIVKGDTIETVLKYVQYDSKDLLTIMSIQTELALQNQQITPEAAQKLLRNYASTLNSYTYLKI
ncbi:MAG: biosynthetic arginine decarboxylase [Pleurocapsa sp. SU_5_0]|nr:biosynthetic arginine decarboxylase [Pleurocapsa sp. SU_5_0]NJR47754.1 biosynthetic arginine decarboxylase [Hyellaceae cyanobacterium CSU_1_1]